jgi:hypothetical protein
MFVVSWAVVGALRQADLEGVLDFLREAETITGPSAFPPELLERLRELVPCDLVNFCELDRPHRKLIRDTYSTGETFEGDDPDDEELQSFWRLRHQHPICTYQDRTGDFSARRLTDFASLRDLRRLEIFSERFSDFRERDCEILDVLLPHLAQLYEGARTRRLAASLAAGADAEGELIVLDDRGAIEFATVGARALLRDYCEEARGARLPRAIEEWLPRDRRRLNGNGIPLGVRTALDRPWGAPPRRQPVGRRGADPRPHRGARCARYATAFVARVAGRGSRRGGQVERGDRRGTLHLARDRAHAPPEHLFKARRA